MTHAQIAEILIGKLVDAADDPDPDRELFLLAADELAALIEQIERSDQIMANIRAEMQRMRSGEAQW
jgi:hypothetical protein